MKTTIALFVMLALCAAALSAQCVPDPTFSVCNLYVVKNDACPITMPNTLVWCPDGDMSYFEISIEALDATGLPCTFTDIRVIVRMGGTPSVAGNRLFGCGFNAAGERFFSLTTDAFGMATAQFWGGGCGCLTVGYEAMAMTGVVFCSGVDNFCVKSPDFTGDGNVNFFDTFQYLPCLGGSYNDCCDLNCDGTVSFFDTFQYLPHLTMAHSCLGSILPIVPCLTPPICF